MKRQRTEMEEAALQRYRAQSRLRVEILWEQIKAKHPSLVQYLEGIEGESMKPREALGGKDVEGRHLKRAARDLVSYEKALKRQLEEVQTKMQRVAVLIGETCCQFKTERGSSCQEDGCTPAIVAEVVDGIPCCEAHAIIRKRGY